MKRIRLSLLKVEKKTSIKEVFASEEINLRDLLNIFKERRTRLLILLIFTLTLGILSVSDRDPVYTSTASIVPEVSAPSQQNRRIRGFASIAGVNIGGASSTGITSPNFYPTIINSEIFLSSIIERKFRFKTFDNKQMSLLEFFINYEDRDIVTKWLKSLSNGSLPKFNDEFMESNERGYGQDNYKGNKKGDFIRFTSQQNRAINRLRRSILVETDDETGIIKVSVTTPERNLSAQLANLLTSKMIDFAVKHQVKKERRNLIYVKRKEKLAKKNFVDSQKRLANFLDKNRNVISARIQVKEEQLKTEAEIQSRVYTQLALQLQDAELTLKEKTPVYSVFQPPIVPLREDKTNHILTVLIFGIVGLFIGLVSVIVEVLIVILK